MYIAELDESVNVCVERNIHHRTKEEIVKVTLMKKNESEPQLILKSDALTTA